MAHAFERDRLCPRLDVLHRHRGSAQSECRGGARPRGTRNVDANKANVGAPLIGAKITNLSVVMARFKRAIQYSAAWQ
jgi:hypothetical protein